MVDNPAWKSFRQYGLIDTLLDILSQGTTARVGVHSQLEEATLYFDSGTLSAATYNLARGAQVIQAVLTWDAGDLEVQAGEPPASLPHDAWIMPPLNRERLSLLAQAVRPASHTASSGEVLRPQAAAPGADALPAQFFAEIETQLKLLVGPFGGVLPGDAAEELGLDLSEVNSATVRTWLETLRELLPEECRREFQIQAEVALRTI
jgi:hypothetical protein